jgi:hypothetical protein
MAFPRIRRRVTIASVALRYLAAVLVAVGSASAALGGEAPGAHSDESLVMHLQNAMGPFVDEKLAAQLGRVVISYKYSIAVLAAEAPEVLDKTDAWLVTFKVTRWTQAVNLFGEISTIPVLIRKRDGAILDIFPHDPEVNKSASDAARKRMASDERCAKCHLLRVRANRDVSSAK